MTIQIVPNERLGDQSPPPRAQHSVFAALPPSAAVLLEPPRFETPTVDRRLRLAEHELTVVTAPAGYGKTAMLTQWFDAASRGTGKPSWLSVNIRNGELADVKSLVGASVCFSHGRPAPDTVEEALAGIDDVDRVIFIDDLHCVEQRVIDELLHWFGQLPGSYWRLVLASRTSVQLSALSAPERTVRSIGPAGLRLEDGDVDHLLHLRAPDLSAAQRAGLRSRIDGWAAGVDLVVDRLTDGASGHGDTNRPDGSLESIADYFEREVLNGLPLSDQDFLIWSSVLAEPIAEACHQVTGDSCSADRLARLGRMHAFVHPSLDRESYQWVPFGREFLLDRLRSRGTAIELEARHRVLRWCLDQRRYDEAVAQAVETGDWFAIVDLVLEAGFDIIGCGRADDLVGWLDQLPSTVVEAESGVAVLAAMALWIGHGDLAGDEIDRWLAVASANRRGRPPCQAESLLAAIDVGRAAFGRLGPKTRKLVAERARRAGIGRETAWDALSHAAAGLAAFLDDEPRAARRALTESLKIQSHLDVESRRWVSRLFSPGVLGLLALIEVESGSHHGRAEALISAAELQSPKTGSPVPGADIVRLAKSRAAMARGDRPNALALSLETARTGHLSAMRVLGYLDAASIYCEQGQSEQSSSCLVEADRLLVGSSDHGRLLTKRRRALERQIQLGRAARRGGGESLTEREAEVLRLLDSDLSRREIGEALYLSFETVKTYVQRLYQKLGVSSRPAAVATARTWGWLGADHGPESCKTDGASGVSAIDDQPDEAGLNPELHLDMPFP